MKIIHVTTLHPSTDARIYYRECISLASIPGHEVCLAAPSANEADLKVNAISLPRPFKFRPLRIMQSSFSLLRLLRSHRADVWHLHDPELLPVAILASFLMKGKFVWDSHEDYLKQLEIRNSKRSTNYVARRFFSKSLRVIFRLVDQRFAGILAATPSIGTFYRNLNTSVVSNDVDHKFYSDLRPSASNDYFLFTGAPNESALLDTIIEAGRTVKFNLVIAGEKPDPRLVFLGNRIFGNRISFLGFQSHESLRKLISGARFGFVTYSNIEQEEDAFPTKLGEFLASGLPIISTPSYFLKDLNLENFGYVSSGFDSNSIAEIISVANQIETQKWNYFSDNGRMWAQENNWENSGKLHLLNFYSVLSKKTIS
jgi:Glycosyltransferase Family 4/Glycosyl transferases group 1